MNFFRQYIVNLIKHKRTIFALAKYDFRSRYLGSFLGFIWAFVNPLATISIFWFVFEVGFKSKPVQDYPFILWLVTGMLPWFYFTEALSGATNSIIENSYLVKKVFFGVSSLPLVKILSNLNLHLFFIVFIFVTFFLYGYNPDLYTIQVVYYLFCMLVLLLGISWITSSLVVFIKDIGYIVNTFLQFGFWLTPIFWSINLIPAKYHKLIKLNPVYYITEGYRDTFIHKIWFWEHPYWTMYFWVVTLTIFIAGGTLFSKLRPHFADVI